LLPYNCAVIPGQTYLPPARSGHEPATGWPGVDRLDRKEHTPFVIQRFLNLQSNLNRILTARPPLDTSSPSVPPRLNVGHWTDPMMRLQVLAIWKLVFPGASHLLGFVPGRLYGGYSLSVATCKEGTRWATSTSRLLDEPGVRDKLASIRAPVFAFSFSDDRLHAYRRAVEMTGYTSMDGNAMPMSKLMIAAAFKARVQANPYVSAVHGGTSQSPEVRDCAVQKPRNDDPRAARAGAQHSHQDRIMSLNELDGERRLLVEGQRTVSRLVVLIGLVEHARQRCLDPSIKAYPSIGRYGADAAAWRRRAPMRAR